MTIVTPNDLYETGTISLTNGSDVVTGDGTFWTAVALRGDALWIADRSLLVKEVLADDQIRIAAPWGGATVADQPYALSYSSWLRYSIAELQGGVRDVLAFWRMGGVRGTRTVSLPTDAITVDDLSKVVVYDSAAPVAVSIPQASADGKLVDGWACWIKVIGAGGVTITPTVSTINETASLALAQGDAALIWSDSGNYLAAVFHVGEDGADGATIMVQDAEPATSYPPGSLWIDQDSPDLDIYRLGGDPLAWTDTGANLKGPQGDAGTDGTNGINGAAALTVVRTAATANVSIASGLEAGDAVSGVTLATNDLVLLTAQTAPAENGVYVVAASGAASRHASFVTYDAHPGCYFSVCEGTGVADTLWRCTSDRGGTIGTTPLAFSQFDLHSGTPTVQRFTSGSGTYTTPAGATWLEVMLVGGGAGGGGGNNSGSATAGGNTTFGTFTAGGGSPAVGGVGGSGGAVGGAGTPNLVAVGGGFGNDGTHSVASGAVGTGGMGGGSSLGGSGRGAQSSNTGQNAMANSGSGGGGGGVNAAASAVSGGGGGGSGATIKTIITSPATTYSYSVGAGGAGASAGTNGGAGGNGAAGLIVVVEHYGS